MSAKGITIQKVITKVDSIKPNAYTDEQKVEWISKVEGTIQAEIMDVAESDIVEYDWNTDSETELIVKAPYYDLYNFYLEAMIDYYNKEFSSYENSMVMFNNAFEEYAKYYQRVKAASVTKYIKNLW